MPYNRDTDTDSNPNPIPSPPSLHRRRALPDWMDKEHVASMINKVFQGSYGIHDRVHMEHGTSAGAAVKRFKEFKHCMGYDSHTMCAHINIQMHAHTA